MKKGLVILMIMVISFGVIINMTSNSIAAGPKKLTFANWMPPMNPVSKGLEEWAREFESKTNGKYVVDIQHGGVLAPIPQAYDVVVSGVADISEIICMDVERPFPLTNIPSMPFFHTTAQLSTEAWFNHVVKKGYLEEEFSEVKLLIQFVGIYEDFLSVNPINNVSELKGLKVVVGGGPTKANLMKKVGAVGVFGGPPDAYMMLQKGIGEAIFISGLGLKEFHWDEFVHYIIEPLRVSSMIHTIAMNKNTYKKMPDDVKAVLEELNGDGRYSLMLAKAFQDIYDQTLDTWLSEGGKSIDWDDAEKAKLHDAAASIWKEWIDEHESKGIQVRKVIDVYYNGLEAVGVKNPALGYTPGS